MAKYGLRHNLGFAPVGALALAGFVDRLRVVVENDANAPAGDVGVGTREDYKAIVVEELVRWLDERRVETAVVPAQVRPARAPCDRRAHQAQNTL